MAQSMMLMSLAISTPLIRHGARQRLQHLSSSAASSGLKVAIVGSGPSGFYTAKYLLRKDPKQSETSETVKEVTMFDRLPVPFGLVRFGVAPDHPEVKNVVDDFTKVASDPRFKFMGNVELSDGVNPSEPHVTLNELRKEFDAVVLTYGAEGDRKLNIEGEDLHGVLSARSFVNWYNGHPEFAHLSDTIKSALERNPNVVILGHGNVALDCARILAKAATHKPIELDGTGGLGSTDITEHSLNTMKVIRNGDIGGVKRVSVVGRRGGAQASFTIKELREMTKLEGVKFAVNKSELEKSNTLASQEEVNNARPKQRLVKLIEDCAVEPTEETTEDMPQVQLRFLLLPQKITADGDSCVSSVQFKRAELVGEAGSQRATPCSDEALIEIPAGLVLSAVGWQSLQADSTIPFDNKRCVIPTSAGARVVEEGRSEAMAPLYAAGWIRRGPSGIIGSNIADSKEAAGAVLEDYNDSSNVHGGGGYEAIKSLLANRGKVVDWEGWLDIDKVEVTEGEKIGKPREKVVSVDKMLSLALK